MSSLFVLKVSGNTLTKGRDEIFIHSHLFITFRYGNQRKRTPRVQV